MKGHWATVLPALGRVGVPLSRDQIYVLFVVLNELILGLESYLAHALNGTLRFREWIPVVCGPTAGLALLVALGLNRKKPRLALWLAVIALLSSVVVGGLGTYFHFVRAIRPFAAPGERVSLASLVWGPSFIAPCAFVLVGVLGLVALGADENGHGGALARTLLPKLGLKKDRACFYLASLGVLIAVVSSVLDHLRGGFTNPWLWVPTLTGVFGVVVAFVLGLVPAPTRADLITYALSMGILLVVGPLGLVLHVRHDIGVGGVIVIERFLRGAPLLAPMVFADMGLLGLLALWDPAKTVQNTHQTLLYPTR